MTPKEQILAWIEQDRDELVRFLSAFVAIPSPNPPGDTRDAARFLADRLRSEGVPIEIRSAKDHLPNVVGIFEGARPGRHLVLNGHIDVFPVGPAEPWSRDPWSGAVEDGKVHGRGVVDMKCGTSASVWTYIYLHRLREHLAGRLALTCVSDEETGGTWGTKWLIETYPDEFRGDCVLNGEPSVPNMIRFGEKGTLRLVFEIDTPGAHAAYTHQSANAIRIAADLIRDLYGLEDMCFEQDEAVRRAIEASGPAIDRGLGAGASGILNRVTVSPGVIGGGLKINMLPGHCRIEVDIRLPVGLNHAAVMAQVETDRRRPPGGAHDAGLDAFERAERLRSGARDGRDPQAHRARARARGARAGGQPRRDRRQALAPPRCPGLRLWLHAEQHGKGGRMGGHRGIPARRAHSCARHGRLSRSMK